MKTNGQRPAVNNGRLWSDEVEAALGMYSTTANDYPTNLTHSLAPPRVETLSGGDSPDPQGSLALPCRVV